MMIIVSEKREIVGTLYTAFGVFQLLDEMVRKSLNPDFLVANVVDHEGFDNWVQVKGDCVCIPSAVPERVDVKRVLTEEEEEANLPTPDVQTDSNQTGEN